MPHDAENFCCHYGAGHNTRVDWEKGLFFARCSCGWQGPERQRYTEAVQDQDQHLGLIGV